MAVENWRGSALVSIRGKLINFPAELAKLLVRLFLVELSEMQRYGSRKVMES